MAPGIPSAGCGEEGNISECEQLDSRTVVQQGHGAAPGPGPLQLGSFLLRGPLRCALLWRAGFGSVSVPGGGSLQPWWRVRSASQGELADMHSAPAPVPDWSESSPSDWSELRSFDWMGQALVLLVEIGLQELL